MIQSPMHALPDLSETNGGKRGGWQLGGPTEGQSVRFTHVGVRVCGRGISVGIWWRVGRHHRRLVAGLGRNAGGSTHAISTWHTKVRP